MEEKEEGENEDEKNKVVVFFDELGLAEIAKNNPLKILHDLLIEPDRNLNSDVLHKRVGFVGISNWRLGLYYFKRFYINSHR